MSDGQEFFIVDERKPAIVDGPFPTRPDAYKAVATDDHSIVSGRVIEMIRDDRPLRDERGDHDVIADGGAIDNDFGEAERSAVQQLIERHADLDAPDHASLAGGDVAIDLVTRQPLYVVERVAHDLVEYYEREEFDLASYKQHPWLPVRMSDPVLKCVFIGDVEGLHNFSNTYDYPAGRLCRVPVELAVEEGSQ